MSRLNSNAEVDAGLRRREMSMTVTDVLCDLCYRTFVASATVEMPAMNGRRSHVCHGCVHALLGRLRVSDEERTKVNRSWPR